MAETTGKPLPEPPPALYTPHPDHEVERLRAELRAALERAGDAAKQALALERIADATEGLLIALARHPVKLSRSRGGRQRQIVLFKNLTAVLEKIRRRRSS